MEKKINFPLEMVDVVTDNLYVGIYVVDGSGTTIYVNKTYEDMSLLPRKELIGKKMDDLVKQKYFNASASLIVLKTKKPAVTTFTTRTNRKLLSHGKPIFDEDNNIKLVINTVYDISTFNKYLEHTNNNISQISEIVAHSAEMSKIVELSLKISRIDSNVLITGESGTGKEVIAKLIYSVSPRKDKPFVKVNCAAIPENLIETELFGYEGGAFTGASNKGKKGFFEVANTGTLFLDEIGELPLNVQAKLLQAIQDKQFTKVGSPQIIKVDVRIIAATNRNLKEMIDQKLFREDLYYRLNVIEIEIPPLRERKDDIEPLTKYILDKVNNKLNVSKPISEDLIKFFKILPWKGNVRELENTIEKLVIFSSEDTISKKDYFAIFGKDYSNLKILQDCDKERLIAILPTCKTIQDIANKLGVSRSTVIRRLKKYNLTFQK